MSELPSILVVDSDAASRRRIQQSITSTLVHCTGVATAQEGLESIRRAPPALVVLDLYLPDMSGLGLARMIRETPLLEDIPIMVVSEYASEMDRIVAFESGVDDFLPKPFYPPELGARIQRLVRSAQPSNAAPVEIPRNSRIRVDREEACVEVDGKALDLTLTELEIIATLVERGGRVVRRRELVELLRGPQAQLSDRAIDAHVKMIRQKLGPIRHMVQTVRGIGYRFDAA